MESDFAWLQILVAVANRCQMSVPYATPPRQEHATELLLSSFHLYVSSDDGCDQQFDDKQGVKPRSCVIQAFMDLEPFHSASKL